MYTESIRERLKIIFLTFLDAIERFWDNRFRRDDPKDEILYLRTELDKARQEYYKLAELFNQSEVSSEPTSDDDSELKPIGGRPHWRVTANRLTKESIEQRKKQQEAANAVQRSVPIVTTEELENELLAEN